MSQVMVRYTVKQDAAAHNEELVRQVYQELHQREPTGIHYATFVLEDGVSFVHLASNDTEDGRNPLMEIAAFRAFQQGIDERCDEPPAPMGLREVGSYGFWAD
jgi:hypothetical protein